MRTASIFAALSFGAAVFAQGPPIGIAPDDSAPEGCETDSKSNFTIGYQSLSTMRKRETGLEAAGNNAVECSLKDGVLYDPRSWIGSIVANYQFQFDGPPQAGAIYTGGFSVCDNSSLAIGGSTRWWKCGSGAFYNLYDRSIGAQCDEIRIVITYVDEPTSSSASSTETSTPTPSTTPLTSVNSTMTTSSSSGSSSGSSTMFSSAPATPTPSGSGVPDAPPSESSGAAVPTRVPRRETFGAVVGIIGAALLF